MISLLIILQDDFNQEWKQVQRQFAEIDENRFYSYGIDGHEYEIGIKQTVVDGLGRIDRCPTCHLGTEEEKYRDTEQPFTTHPGALLVSHKARDFGCTSCHLGQGFAVTYEKAAHEKLEFWNETMLPKELIQASCGTCHLSEEVPEAAILTSGRIIIRDKGCTGCHDIAEFFEEEPRGPDLAGIGNKVTRGWLFHWLKDPQEYLKNSRMPTFKLEDEEILNLVAYLMSLDEKDSPPHPVTGISAEAGNEDRGQTLIGESRCISCHSINSRGGKLAPELARVGDKVREEWLPNFLRNVHYYQPTKIMLEYNFTDQNALDISAYVFEEFSEEEFEIPETVASGGLSMSDSRKAKRIKDGKKLYGKYGCDGCHTIAGKRLSSKIGAKLTNIGSRLESSLDFGNITDVKPTLYNWLYMKLKQPDVFDSSSMMPQFHLSDREAFAVTIALLSNRHYEYSSRYLVPEKKESIYKKPSGAFGDLFEKYSCISCHSIDKYGGDISTAPLTIEGSKVKFEWLKEYLVKPYAIRPLLTERMPRFRMTERESAVMADYIKSVYVSDDIPRFMEYELTAEEGLQGKQLFYEMECTSCHIIDQSGGYVGPQLDDVGDRLEAGWMYTWLLTPLKYKPETIHPDYGFTDEQARQLTAFLITRKKVKR